MPDTRVHRLDFGYFLRPGVETHSGLPRVEPCLGYLIERGDATIIFDTGMGGNAEVDAHYRPRRRDLGDALAAVGSSLDQVTQVVNCHLHFDHCGGNPQLAGRPVFVQATELQAARDSVDYTLPELIEDGQYVELAGEAEILSGVFVIPTPGHTDGHQSLVLTRADGTVVVAGQSHDGASEYAADQLSWRASHGGDTGPLPEVAAWVERLQSFDPKMIFFAHDHAVWVP